MARKTRNALTLLADSTPIAPQREARIPEAWSRREAVRLGLWRTIDDVVAFIQSGQQAMDLFRRILQVVVVQRHDRLAARGPNAAQQGVVLAMVARQAQAEHAGIGRSQLLDDAPGVVAAAVFHEDDLERPADLLERADEPRRCSSGSMACER